MVPVVFDILPIVVVAKSKMNFQLGSICVRSHQLICHCFSLARSLAAFFLFADERLRQTLAHNLFVRLSNCFHHACHSFCVYVRLRLSRRSSILRLHLVRWRAPSRYPRRRWLATYFLCSGLPFTSAGDIASQSFSHLFLFNFFCPVRSGQNFNMQIGRDLCASRRQGRYSDILAI